MPRNGPPLGSSLAGSGLRAGCRAQVGHLPPRQPGECAAAHGGV